MKVNILFLVVMTAILASCGDSDDVTPGGGNNNNNDGNVKITSTSPEYTFWGDELTITGTGFSAVKEENIVRFVNYSSSDHTIKYYSNGGDIEIISASTTQLKIRVPYGTTHNEQGDDYFGLDKTALEVSVKDDRDTANFDIKFIGLPQVGLFVYHYGWSSIAGITRVGDSVMIGSGFHGAILGAGVEHPKAAGVWNKLRLKINGGEVPIKYREISIVDKGWSLYLPVSTYAELNCDEGVHPGWNDRAMTFQFYIEGTDKKDDKIMYMQYLPEQDVDEAVSSTGSRNFKKSSGGFPELVVTGENMYYTTARFVPQAQCTGAYTVVDVQNTGVFSDELHVGIPLAALSADCIYTVVLYDDCGTFAGLGQIGIQN